jgi:hypothetical protein
MEGSFQVREGSLQLRASRYKALIAQFADSIFQTPKHGD